MSVFLEDLREEAGYELVAAVHSLDCAKTLQQYEVRNRRIDELSAFIREASSSRYIVKFRLNTGYESFTQLIAKDEREAREYFHAMHECDVVEITGVCRA